MRYEMLPQKYWERLKEIYRQQGFVVFGTRIPRKIGEWLPLADAYGLVYQLPQPFRVMEEGTAEEYLAQGNWGGEPCDPSEAIGKYFYRAVTE